MGHGEGGDSREKLRFPGKGPTAVISDLGILTPDPGTKELLLTSIHPGVTVEQVVAATGWLLVKIAPDLSDHAAAERDGTLGSARSERADWLKRTRGKPEVCQPGALNPLQTCGQPAAKRRRDVESRGPITRHETTRAWHRIDNPGDGRRSWLYSPLQFRDLHRLGGVLSAVPHSDPDSHRRTQEVGPSGVRRESRATAEGDSAAFGSRWWWAPLSLMSIGAALERAVRSTGTDACDVHDRLRDHHVLGVHHVGRLAVYGFHQE